jgi:hypothetical protein
MLCNQVISTGWFSESMTDELVQEQRTAILAFLASVKPVDAVEGMMAAQLYASHASAMECYRRAMLPGQTLEGKQIHLTLAAKLTRANAAQVEALKKYRGKGEQKVIVEHVHVYRGGQAIVGNVTSGGLAKIRRFNPMQLDMDKAPRCGAKTRSGKPCHSPAMPNGRCRMHGGGRHRGRQRGIRTPLSMGDIQRRRSRMACRGGSAGAYCCCRPAYDPSRPYDGIERGLLGYFITTQTSRTSTSSSSDIGSMTANLPARSGCT